MSAFWAQFNQAVIKKTEISCIIYKKCNLVLTHLTYTKNDSSEMKKHIQSQDYDLNAIINQTRSDIFTMLISYLQDIMITIYDNNS